jgi:O-antigen/teichoic acid export membrane protein
MEEKIASNKLIAKNATMLYIRMFVSMAISFFTSRIVLQALGVNDYGIFNLVAGIILLINILSGALNTSTSRFLTYSIGRGSLEEIKKTFSTALIIHFLLAFVFVFAAETVGLWFVNTQLVIDANRIVAANWVYQAAVISTVFAITQVPYNSLLTSHEHFGVFAYIDILNSVLKLSISLIIIFASCDRLILYSILYVSVAIFIMMLNRFYCLRHFEESHFIYVFNKFLMKQMLTFSGWNLFNGASFTCFQQGQNILINRFFGTAINAAVGIASQVQVILYGFISNISSAFYPQITKSYANANYSRVNYLIRIGGLFSSVLCLLTTVPLMIKMQFLMEIWLKEVPNGAVSICKLLLIVNFFNSFNPLVSNAINATGKNRIINIICGFIYLGLLPAVYILLRIFHSYVLIYVVSILLPIMTGISYIVVLHLYMKEFDMWGFIFKLILPQIGIGLITLCLAYFLNNLIHNNWLSLVLITMLTFFVIIMMTYFFLLDKYMKHKCIEVLKAKLHY